MVMAEERGEGIQKKRYNITRTGPMRQKDPKPAAEPGRRSSNGKESGGKECKQEKGYRGRELRKRRIMVGMRTRPRGIHHSGYEKKKDRLGRVEEGAEHWHR